MKKVSWQATVFQAAGGSVAPLALVRFLTQDDSLADVWSDRDGTNSIPNPIVTDESGFAVGYLTPGVYKVQITADQVFRTLENVVIPSEGSTGVEEWFSIPENTEILPEHTGKTCYVESDSQVLIPSWNSLLPGFFVDFILAEGAKLNLLIEPDESVRAEKRRLIGDGTLRRLPATDSWAVSGDSVEARYPVISSVSTNTEGTVLNVVCSQDITSLDPLLGATVSGKTLSSPAIDGDTITYTISQVIENEVLIFTFNSLEGEIESLIGFPLQSASINVDNLSTYRLECVLALAGTMTEIQSAFALETPPDAFPTITGQTFTTAIDTSTSTSLLYAAASTGFGTVDVVTMPTGTGKHVVRIGFACPEVTGGANGIYAGVTFYNAEADVVVCFVQLVANAGTNRIEADVGGAGVTTIISDCGTSAEVTLVFNASEGTVGLYAGTTELLIESAPMVDTTAYIFVEQYEGIDGAFDGLPVSITITSDSASILDYYGPGATDMCDVALPAEPPEIVCAFPLNANLATIQSVFGPSANKLTMDTSEQTGSRTLAGALADSWAGFAVNGTGATISLDAAGTALDVNFSLAATGGFGGGSGIGVSATATFYNAANPAQSFAVLQASRGAGDFFQMLTINGTSVYSGTTATPVAVIGVRLTGTGVEVKFNDVAVTMSASAFSAAAVTPVLGIVEEHGLPAGDAGKSVLVELGTSNIVSTWSTGTKDACGNVIY